MDIGSCMFTAGFAGDHAIRAVFLMIGGRPMIFGIMVDMDQKVCVSLRSSLAVVTICVRLRIFRISAPCLV